MYAKDEVVLNCTATVTWKAATQAHLIPPVMNAGSTLICVEEILEDDKLVVST
jgi:hypothetical protein